MSSGRSATLASAESPENIQILVDQLASQGAHGSSQKADALAKLWALTHQDDLKKDEVLKLAVVPRLLSIIDAHASAPEASYAAVGCLASLAAYQKALEELTATGNLVNRVIQSCLSVLQGGHDRSKLPAAQVLVALSEQPALVPRLDPVMPTLLKLLSGSGGPGWAGGRQLVTAAAAILQALLEPSEYEQESVKQARRMLCMSSGLVPCLLGQLSGASDKLLLSVAASLRFIALAPAAADVLAGEPEIAAQLMLLLGRGGAGVQAFVSGIIWELAAAPTAAQQLLDAGAVPALLAVLQLTAGAAGYASKKKGKAAESGNSKGNPNKADAAAARKSSGAEKGGSKGRPGSAAAGGTGGTVGPPGTQPAAVLMSDPEAAAAVALCNTTGALNHLSFLDDGKQQIGNSPYALKLMVKLLSLAKDQTYDNLVGCLWNVGLLQGNQEKLAAAGAPAHLVQPVPNRWACTAEKRTSSITGASRAVHATSAGVVAASSSTRVTGPWRSPNMHS